MVDIYYWHSVVGENTYATYTKMGVTLSVLKNEIKDFFFARLGTGGNYDPPLRFGRRIERRYVYKWYGVLVSILYTHNVVGGVVNCTGVIYGVRIHRTVALRRRT